MAKAGMRRPDPKDSGPKPPKNEMPPVPEIQGRAKTSKKKAKPMDRE
ncbi:MAG: hypothetical protein ACOX3Q_10630 [Clostridia bacterium]|jgi:hypothetical protein|nr:hypothetical protein [Clostridiaceae bacterium]